MIITVTLNTAIDRVVEVEGMRPGRVNQGTLRRLVPAGKAVNVSCVLGALGVPSVATGFVGADDMPFFDHNLEKLECKCPPVPRFTAVGGRTRVNTTIVDPAHNHETHIREAGLSTSKEEKEALLADLGRLVKPEDYVVVSGSLPFNYSVEDLIRLIECLKARGASVLLDCSPAGVTPWKNNPLWGIMLNREEISQALGKTIVTFKELVEAARETASAADVVLTSDGAHGAIAITGSQALHGQLDLPQRQVRNTVGAGDSLVAGFVAGWAAKDNFEYAMRLAQATATSKVMHFGSSEIDPAYVTKAIARVKIKWL